MLIDIILKEFTHLELQKLFPIGFAVLKDFIIISSQSIGMFNEDKKISIISSPLLRKMVKASDGDVNYIKGCLRTLKETIDQSYTKTSSEIRINDYSICFDIGSIKHFLYFPEHKYLSTNELENLERDSAETGYTFVGNLDQNPPKNE